MVEYRMNTAKTALPLQGFRGKAANAFNAAVALLRFKYPDQTANMLFFDAETSAHLTGAPTEKVQRFKEERSDLFNSDGSIRRKQALAATNQDRTIQAIIFNPNTYADIGSDVDRHRFVLFHEFWHHASKEGMNRTTEDEGCHPLCENVADGGGVLSLYSHDRNGQRDWSHFSAYRARRALERRDMTHLTSITIDMIAHDIHAGTLSSIKDQDVGALAEAYAAAYTPPDDSLQRLSLIGERLRDLECDRNPLCPEEIAKEIFSPESDIYVQYIGAKILELWLKNGFDLPPLEEDITTETPDNCIVFNTVIVEEGRNIPLKGKFWDEMREKIEMTKSLIPDQNIAENFMHQKHGAAAKNPEKTQRSLFTSFLGPRNV
jgi:hypothetical protein